MPSKKRKQRRLYTTIAILLIVTGLLSWAYIRISRALAPPASSTVAAPSKIQKDIPVKDQIIQKNDKEIIKEMLDSGEKVGAISKKTGIRRDEIRKIKKEKAQEEKK